MTDGGQGGVKEEVRKGLSTGMESRMYIRSQSLHKDNCTDTTNMHTARRKDKQTEKDNKSAKKKEDHLRAKDEAKKEIEEEEKKKKKSLAQIFDFS